MTTQALAAVERLAFHPYADVLPSMDGPDFDALVDDIRRHGLRNEITLYDDMVLDGRNRYRACIAAGVEPRVRAFVGTPDEALAYVASVNLHRRHLTESQRAMAAAKLSALAGKSANLRIGAGAAAKALKVSGRSVTAARKVSKRGDDELVAAVERGEVAVSAAAEVAELPKAEQRALLAGEGKLAKRVAAAAKRVKASKAKRPTVTTATAVPLLSPAATATAAVRTQAAGEIARVRARYLALLRDSGAVRGVEADAEATAAQLEGLDEEALDRAINEGLALAHHGQVLAYEARKAVKLARDGLGVGA